LRLFLGKWEFFSPFLRGTKGDILRAGTARLPLAAWLKLQGA